MDNLRSTDIASPQPLPHRNMLYTSGMEPRAQSHRTVTIPKLDFDDLLQRVREYNALRQALFRGGISEETLEVLINGSSTLDETQDSQIKGKLTDSHVATGGPAIYNHNFDSTNADTRQGTLWQESSSLLDHRQQIKSCFGSDLAVKQRNGNIDQAHFQSNDGADLMHSDWFVRDDSHGNGQSANHQRQPSRNEQRTILLCNLSDRTGYKDIVNIIRGGAILSIYLRSNERTASVSFVHGTSAQDFFAYAKRNDIYIHDKRITVRWSDRQFVLPGHVASRIADGATRNLLLRNLNDRVTEEGIRTDLEHIHKLVVVDAQHHGDMAHISLDSVHNALFARTCLMSRGLYKNARITWYPDECAGPLSAPKAAVKKENRPPPAKPSFAHTQNRFGFLNMDGTEDGSDDEDQATKEMSSVVDGTTTTSWAETSVNA